MYIYNFVNVHFLAGWGHGGQQMDRQEVHQAGHPLQELQDALGAVHVGQDHGNQLREGKEAVEQIEESWQEENKFDFYFYENEEGLVPEQPGQLSVWKYKKK